MTGERVHYTKLPGHRRGLVNGSSLWLAPDHLLLVKSQRFREEYKRFYLRDIQAIAIARHGRFHVSSRAMVVGFFWFIALGMSAAYPRMTGIVWSTAFVLVSVWLYISVDRSCICRIYTAVSSDSLPSVYRSWTARHFLAAVQPRILEVQGALDPEWLDAAGAPEPEAGRPAVPTALHADSVPETGTRRTAASDMFLASLFLGAVVDAAAFRLQIPSLPWVITGIATLQSMAAIGVFIDRSRGRLRSGIHTIAIGKLIWLSLLFYIDTAFNAALGLQTVPIAPANDLLRGIDLAITVGLLVVGLTISWRPE
jgi:hypothetical protein